MKRINFLLAAALMATTVLTTSCLGDDDATDNNDYTLYGYCTIAGTNPNYKFYFDGGGLVIPSTTSITTATSGTGFGNNTRAYFYMTYKGKNYTTNSDGEVQVTEAEIQTGTILPVRNIRTQSEAFADSITANDSIYTITSLDNVWAYRGYLTTLVTGPYATNTSGALYPRVNLVYNPEDVSENAIKFHLYYNARNTTGTSMSSYTYSFATSYPLYYLANIVPGSGDITMTFDTDGGESKSIAVTRDNLTPPSDVTFTGAE